MKTQLSAFLLVIVSNAPWAGFAADDTKHDQNAKVPSTDKPQAAQPLSPQQEKCYEVALTGSNIKQKIRQTGRITDGANPVVVIGRIDIDRSGAQDLKQL